tara:strand:- start:1848 stop:2084 length:237 start_codon:yes stop_codon:yes gene_type:complete
MAKEFMTMDEYASSLVGNAAPTMKKKGMAKGGKVKKKGYAKGGAVGMKKKGMAKGGKVQKMAGGGMMKKKGMAKGGKV